MIIKNKFQHLISFLAAVLLLFSTAILAYATTQKNWTFSDSAQYTFNSTKIEFSGGQAQLKSDFFNSNWDYRQTVEVTNTGSALSNYQVKITISSSNPNFWSHVKNDGSDIRFTDSNKTTLLSHFTESFEAAAQSAIIWVKIPTIEAASTKTIYLYYGNTTATTTSSGESTFTFFEDFNGSSINTAVWNTTGGAAFAPYYVVSNSYLNMTSGCAYSKSSVETYSQNSITESKLKWTGTAAAATLEGISGLTIASRDRLYGGNSSAEAAALFLSTGATSTFYNLAYAASGTTTGWNLLSGGSVYSSPSFSTDYIYSTEFNGSSSIIFRVRDMSYNQLASRTVTGTWNRQFYIILGNYNGALSYRNNIDDVAFDWIRVRQYATPEPSVAINTIEAYTYPTDNPAIQPITSEAQSFTSLSYFAETATKNSGEIKYNISNNAGTSWYYWNSVTSSWEAADGTYNQANTAADINTNIASFAQGNLQFLFKAFLHSLGTQEVQLDNVTVTCESMSVNQTINITTQPTAGATAIRLKASFNDATPNTNQFYVALNTSDFGSATSGEGSTSNPATQETAVGTTLTGYDYINKIKCVHTNSAGEYITSEATLTNEAYKYVKPYTPSAPTLAFVTNSSLNVTVNKNAAESDNVHYSIYETTQNKFVQTNGTLGTSETYQTREAWGITIEVTGLTPPISTYIFKTRSKNPNNTTGNTTSELSTSASIANIPPIGGYSQEYFIPSSQVSQSTNGSGLVTINFRAKDTELHSCSLESFSYSTNEGASWLTPTNGDISGAFGSSWPDNGGLRFTAEADFTGPIYSFTVNSKHSDLTEFSGSIITGSKFKFLLNDATDNSVQATTTETFVIDNKLPVGLISAEVSSQPQAGDSAVDVFGTFTENYPSSNLFYVAVNGGSFEQATTGESSTATPATAEVTVSMLDGDDYISRIKIIATDAFGNVGTNETTSLPATVGYVKPYTPLTPTVSNATASTVDISVNAHANESIFVEYALHSTTHDKYVQATGTLDATVVWQTQEAWGTKTVTGLSSPLYTTFEVRAKNPNNSNTFSDWSGSASASNTPPVGGFTQNYFLPASLESQSTNGSGLVTIYFKAKDAQAQTCSLESFQYSPDGTTWYSPGDASGALGGGWPNNNGARYSSATDFSGTLHSFTFNTQHADVSGFSNQYLTGAKIRFILSDGVNTSTQATTSESFTIDNLAPTKLITAEITTTPEAGATAASVYGTFTEINPSSNVFFAAINGESYGNSTSGEGSTAAPATKEVTVTTLDGNDYISKIKIVETDSFGNVGTNENTSPSGTFAYVKPYTPLAPTVTNATATTVQVSINAHTSETNAVEYAIFDNNESKYVQSAGTLGATAVWKAASNWGTVEVSGLTNSLDSFQVISRNPNNPALNSFSNWSGAAQASNTPPIGGYSSNYSIPAAQISQATDGSGTLTISFRAKSARQLTCSLESFAYSTNEGSSWLTPTNGDASAALAGSWPANNGSRYSSATDFSGTVYTFTVNTKHADLSGFNDVRLTTARVRFLLNDGTDNSTQPTTSESFSLDNLSPATAVTTNLTQTPEAGSQVVQVYGTFTETSPSTNVFYVAINGASYGGAVTGESGTASPATKEVAVQTLTGADYISKVKIVETDTLGNVGTNENTSPSTAYKYVKPYTPSTPTINNATASTVDIAVNPYADESSSVVYAIYSVTTSQYVQSGGTLGDSAVWKTASSWETVTVTGLADPINTNFKVRALNPNDTSLNALSEWSPTANASNTPPIGGYSSNYYIPSAQISQATDGSGVITVNFRAKDAQTHTCSLEGFYYSTDGISWSTPTSGDASAALAGSWPTNSGSRYSSATDFSGTVYSFTFNSKHTDISGFSNAYKSGAKIRFLLQDGVDQSTQNTTTDAFIIDNLTPQTALTAEVTTAPSAGNTTVAIYGTFTEHNPATNLFSVALNGGSYGSAVSGESGTASPATKEVTVSTLDGDDYISKIKISATDTLGNVGTNENISLTSNKYIKPYTPGTPTVNNATASTVDIVVNAQADEVNTVQYAIYDEYASKYVQTSGTLDSTATWQTKEAWGTKTVTGLTSPLLHTFKIISRNPNDPAGTTYSDWSSSGSASNTPPIGGYESNYYIPATQISQSTEGNGIMTINFRAKDAQQHSCSLESFAYSLDGITWFSPLNGDSSAALSGSWPDNSGSRYNSATDFSGTLYSFTFNTQHADIAGLTNTYKTTVKVRFKLQDGVDSSTQVTTSAAFAVDNLIPSTLSTAALTTSLEAGDTTVNVYGTFTETNPSTNWFYVGISGADYGDLTTGEAGTATPATCEVVTSPLTGADYISKIKIVATDSYGNVGTNESTATSATYKYVKPYAPMTPSVTNATASTVDIAINAHASESSSVEYSVYNSTSSQYVQSDGSLGSSVAWKTQTNWGTITVTGVASPLATNFKVKSRNPNDTSGNTQSEWSPTANASNTPPIGGYSSNYYIPSTQISQSTDGLGILTINFRVKDAQTHSCSLESFAYTIDGGSRWYSPINEDASAALGGVWPDNNGARLTAEADFSGPIYSFTVDTQNSEIAGFNNVYRSNVKIRFLANDGIDSSIQVTTTDAFVVDNLAPARLSTVEIVTQPNAGDTTVPVYGTFSEVTPLANTFYAALNGSDYSGSTSGEGATASPATCEVTVATLDGNDYISKIKIVESDTFGNQGANENTSPSGARKYVKPYVPLIPLASNPTDFSADITVRKATAEATGLEYAIFATHEGESGGQYVQANGFLSDTASWETIDNWGSSGTITVLGLEAPVRNYYFRTKSRNSSDASHQSSSESDFSSSVQAISTSTPEIISYSPTHDAIGVDISPVIQAEFSEKMLAETVEFFTTLTAIRDHNGNTISYNVTGEAQYNSGTKIVSFIPESNLQYGYTYNFNISTGVTNLVGTAIAAPLSVDFTTITSSAESNTTISTDSMVWIIAPAGTLPGYGYFRINRDPINSPIDVNPTSITLANNKVSAEGNPYHYPIESSITETLAYSTSEVEITTLNQSITLRMYYTDDDNDGIVDDVSPSVRASDLLIYRLNEDSALWVKIPSSVVNTTSKYVYATVSRLGTYTLMANASTDTSNAYAYPVPFKPSAGHTVITFTNLPTICTIKIFTIAGELVKTIPVSSSSLQATWDGKNSSGINAASGVYIYMVEGSTERKLGKLIIIR